MLRMCRALSVVLLIPALAVAQGKPVVEIGTNLGVAIQSGNGASLTHFGIPGQGILGQPTLYASFFAGERLVVEPQVALNILSSDGETATSVGLGGQLGYLFNGPDLNSPFIAAGAAFQSVSGGGFSDSEFGLGGKVGYRLLAGNSVGVRIEAGYRRWLDAELNEFSIGIGIGGIVRRSQ